MEDSANKVTSLSDKSTDTQYPSAKAVYDALQNVGGGEKEWKCVFDGRMEVGQRIITATTFQDGTPLNAKEVIVQVLSEEVSTVNMQGYVSVKSTNNKTETLYGAFYTEHNDANKIPCLQQIKMKASPLYMVAEIFDGLVSKAAQGSFLGGRAGNKNTPQIYEDIVQIKVESNAAIASVAPIVKIYAR